MSCTPSPASKASAGPATCASSQRRAGAGDERASLALEVFAYRVAGAIAAMAVATGGLDALVFTAGIGENSAFVRDRVCARLGFLGVELDAERNGGLEPDCDTAAKRSAGTGARHPGAGGARRSTSSTASARAGRRSRRRA